MIRKFGGTTGIDIQPSGLDLGLGGSNIKSIQTGYISISNNSINNVTISPVKKENSIVRVQFSVANLYYGDDYLSRGKLTSATNVELQNAHYNGGEYVYWEVIEFNNVKSIQTGELTSSLQTNTITISNVNINKSLIQINQMGSNTQAINSGDEVTVSYFYNSTSFVLQQHVAKNKTIDWQVIEFN